MDAREENAARRLSRRLALVVWRARLALFWERLWPALWPLSMVAGATLLYLLSGLPTMLPAWARLAVAVLLAGAAMYAARGLATVRWPHREEALRRVEAASGLAHHPLLALDDAPVAPFDEPQTRRIWRAHLDRITAAVRRLRAGWPRSTVARRDPYALRFALLLSLVTLTALGGPRRAVDSLPALIPAFDVPSAREVTLDAWLTPPAYTGRPPIVLAAAGEVMRPKQGAPAGAFVTPSGARLSVRMSGGRSPQLVTLSMDAAGSPQREIARKALTADKTGEENAFSGELVLRRSAIVSLRDGGEIATWRIRVTPDRAPRVALTESPAATLMGGLVLKWKARDDYGLARLRAEIRLADDAVGARANTPHRRSDAHARDERPSSTDGKHVEEITALRGPLAYDPPDFDIPLPGLDPKKADGRLTHMTASHPWAGLPVTIRLVATDRAGNAGYSRTHRIVLPARVFRKPLARALVEQRRELVMRPTAAREVAVMLAAFTAWPQGLIDDSAVYLGLRHVARLLHEARSAEELKTAVALLWELAVKVEDGDLADARRQLEAARKALEDALARGAPPEEIAELMRRMREAMNRYLQSMARQARRRQGERFPRGQAMREISPQDLQRMLDRIENLARTGSRDAARRMLSELDNLLQNLQPNGGAMAGNSPEGRMLGELQRLLRDQQRLMDRTWQARPPRTGDAKRDGRGASRRDDGARGHRKGRGGMADRDGMPAPGGTPRRDMEGPAAPRPGTRGHQPDGGGGADDGFGDLARRQEDLARRLRDLSERMMREGAKPPRALGRAGDAMDRAGRALGRGGRKRALDNQRQALDALREGARELARRLARQGRMQGGRIGRNDGGRDPLGRPMRQYGDGYGPMDDMIPPETAVEKARRILDALRERAARPDRPRIELDYIDRLLRDLY